MNFKKFRLILVKTVKNQYNNISCKELARWIQYHTRFAYSIANNNCIHYARKLGKKFAIQPEDLNDFHLNVLMKARDE